MSDMYNNFVQQRRANLSNIGSNVSNFTNQMFGIAQQKRAAEAEAIKRGEYNKLKADWFESGDTTVIPQLQDMYPEEFAGEIAAWDKMDEIGRKSKVQDYGEVVARLTTGDNEAAADKLAIMGRAYRENGQYDEGEKLQEFSRRVLSGDENALKATQRYFEGKMAIIPEGQDALESISTVDSDNIKQGEFALKVMTTGAGIEKNSVELKSMEEAAKNDPEFGDTILASLRYANALEGGLPLSNSEFNNTIIGLRKEFQTKSKVFMDYQGAAETLSGLLDSAAKETDPDAIGLIDISAINLFQRGIDPATVREGDVALIQSAKSLAERLLLVKDSLTGGNVLSPEQRQEMRDISEQLVVAKKAYVDEVIYPSIHATHKRLDPKGNTYKEVFSGYTPLKAEPAPVTSTEDPNEPGVVTMSAEDFFGGK